MFLSIYPDGVPNSVWDNQLLAERSLLPKGARQVEAYPDPSAGFGLLAYRLQDTRRDENGTLYVHVWGWIVPVQYQPS